MPRRVTIHYVSLRSCLVNLPISMYGPLVSNGVRPQTLAVHLLKPGGSGAAPKEGYVGWTGMASASSLAQLQSQTTRGKDSSGSLETVEIDPQFASALGFQQGDVVEIGLLHDLSIAQSISTEPLTADDWEILELHAGYVEDNLLTQVRAACVDQEIDVWVLGRTRIRFRVVSTDPPASSSKKAVLLSTNTEVCIAPKLRNQSKTQAPATTAAKQTNGDKQPSSESTPASSPATPRTLPIALRNLPPRLVNFSIRPEPLSDEPCTVYVSPSTFIRIFPGRTLPIRPSNLALHASIRVLPPPTTGSVPVASGSGSGSQALASTPSAKLLLDGKSKIAAAATKEEDTAPTEERVVVRPMHGLLEKHLVVNGQLPRSNVSDWDLVSVFNGEEEWSGKKATAEKEDASVPLRARFADQTSQTNELAGVDHLLDKISSFMIRSFALQGELSGAPSRASTGIPALLLCGAPGSGRTSLAKEAIRRLSSDPRVFAHHIYVDLAKLSDERIAVLKTLFDKYVDIASWHKPSVIILDNLDRVIGPEVEHADSSRQRQLAEHFISSFSPTIGARGVVLLATCQGPTSLHPLLSSTHIFSDRVTLRAPDKNARRDILSRLVEKHIAVSDLSQSSTEPLNYVALATQTEGYSATDLKDLVGRAVHQAAIRALGGSPDTPVHILSEDFTSAQVDFTPLSLRDVKLQKSEVEWSDIGGLHETRRVLRETLEWPTKYGAIFAKCPIRLRSGLLLYGYPGCGKTLLASAVAKECGLNFISVKGPELLNKYIGASEKSVRDLFDRATAAKPCVLFFDEFDSIAPKRGHDSTGVTDRVVNQMLTQMDGAEGLEGVYVLAATSRPDLIDPALLRPGRLDKSLLCNMPDVKERVEILNALRRKVTLSEDVDVEEYAALTEGFSGADLQALVYNAHLDAVHASITEAESHKPTTDETSKISAVQFAAFGGPTGSTVLSRADEAVRERRLETIMENVNRRKVTKVRKAPRTKAKPVVVDVHLRNSLKSTRPSVSPEEHLRLSRIYASFVSDRSGEMKVPPDTSGIGARASLG